MVTQDDDDKFDISKIPYLQSLIGDKETADSVEPESSPIDLVAGMGAGALTDAMAPAAEQILGNETGSLDLSALKKIIANGADDVAGAVTPPTPKGGTVIAPVDDYASQLSNESPPLPRTGPNALAMETQKRARDVDFQQRLAAQKLEKLKALMNK